MVLTVKFLPSNNHVVESLDGEISLDKRWWLIKRTNQKMIYQIIYPPFVKTPEGILLLHYVGCRHYGDVLQFMWLNCLRKRSSMDIAIVGNHLEEYAMDISRISPDLLWVPVISKSLRHDYQDNFLRINLYCNSCYYTTNVRWNKLWKCCCLIWAFLVSNHGG